MKKEYDYLTLPIKILAVIWISYIADLILINVSFTHLGLLPRTVKGLIGIISCPFIHANLFHIISNSIPLFVLLSITAVFFKRNSYYIVVLIIVLGGIMVWIFGRSSYHVGASGLVYGLAAFLIAFGVYKKKIIPLIVSLFIAFTYGISMLVGLLPVFPGVSWEGHLFGAVAGVITAKIASMNISI
jgi:membrane associated rhomboid family serine protease